TNDDWFFGGAWDQHKVVARELDFETRAEAVTWVGAGNVRRNGVVFYAAGFAYMFDSGTTAITDMSGVKPALNTYPDHFGANVTPGTTLVGAYINSAIQYIKGLGGGVVHFTADTYLTDETILIDRNITLAGNGWYFVNDYIDDAAVIRGSVIKQADAANVTVVKILSDQADNVSGSFPRIHGGVRDIAIHGNRSEKQGPSNTDLNSTGHGVDCQGVSYVTLTDVLLFRCPEVGFKMQSHDYADGNGVRSCNNISLTRVVSTSNAGNGFDLFGGDSQFAQLVAGYNGGVGVTGNAGPIVSARVWNNQDHGMSLSGAMLVSSAVVYDNKNSGINISGEGISLDACRIYGNAVAASATVSETCGVFLTSTANDISITDCVINNETTTTQIRGITCLTSGVRVILDGNRVEGNTTSDVFLTDYTVARLHGDTGSTAVRHVGFTMAGGISQSGEIVSDKSGSGTVNTSASTLFNADTDGAVWKLVLAHAGGSISAEATISGDAATPLIISQASAGATTVTFSVSGTDIQAVTAAGSYTSNWSAMRLV
ncbi:hypothetical protein, partial [Profundibacter sp.]